MKVALDTNVLISGLLVPAGPPGRIIDLWIDGAVKVALSPDLLEEYISVLARPRFDAIGPLTERRRILEQLVSLANTEIIVPGVQVDVVKEDPADNAVLSCAVEARADYVVTGDRHLLRLGEYGGIPIVNPVAFLDRAGFSFHPE